MKPSNQQAVSPVVGVMLMLVVVIIIAAIVSGFAGGLIGKGSSNAPTLTMDVKMINTGSFAGSGFFAAVTGVSEPIPTKDLQIVTSWSAANGVAPVSGGNTTSPSSPNIDVLFDPTVPISNGIYVAPFGNGPGVGNGTETLGGVDTRRDLSSPVQQFGNYSLMTGTTMSAQPCGAVDGDSIGGATPASGGYGTGGRFTYSSGGPWLDATSAVLGPHWEKLRIGDTVNIRVIHIPTGKVIFNKDIQVTEG